MRVDLTDLERSGEPCWWLVLLNIGNAYPGHPERNGISSRGELIIRSVAPESATDSIPAPAG